MTPYTTTDWSWAKKPKAAKPFEYDKKAGQRALTGLIEARSAEYDNFYAPVASSLGEMAKAPFDIDAAREAGQTAARTFDASAGALERQQRGLGVAQSAGQGDRLSLRRILAEVDASNRKLDGDNERRSLAQQFSMDQYSDLYGNAGSIYNLLSEREINRKAQHTQARSAVNSGAMGAAGTVAGIAASFM
jgi:hypothetical protein